VLARQQTRLVSTVYPARHNQLPSITTVQLHTPTLPSLRQQHVPSQLAKSASNNNVLRHPSLPSQSRNHPQPTKNGDRHRRPATPQLLHRHHHYYHDSLLIDIIIFITRLTLGRPAAAAAVAQLRGQRADAAAAGGAEL
jgi:hypothetical protein